MLSNFNACKRIEPKVNENMNVILFMNYGLRIVWDLCYKQLTRLNKQ